jgi:hypothetical protein
MAEQQILVAVVVFASVTLVCFWALSAMAGGAPQPRRRATASLQVEMFKTSHAPLQGLPCLRKCQQASDGVKINEQTTCRAFRASVNASSPP